MLKRIEENPKKDVLTVKDHRETEVMKFEKPFFLLTLDIESLASSFTELGYSIPHPDFFRDLENDLVKDLRSCFSNVIIKYISYNTLRNAVKKIVEEEKERFKDAIIVSICHRYFKDEVGHYIKINRIVDIEGNSLGIGQRPYSLSFDEQINVLKNVIGDRPIILTDDGSFNAETSLAILQKLKDNGLSVVSMIFGILFPGAKESLSGLRVSSAFLLEDCIDWLPERDFYPFFPDSGKVVGINWLDPSPVIKNGASYSMPYVYPYGDPVGWACIPDDKALNFSVSSFRRTIKFYKEMERINERSLSIKDVKNMTSHRISIPVKRGTEFPEVHNDNTRILDVLKTDLESLKKNKAS